MDTIESPLYKNINHFLRCFPVCLICKFMNELKGLLHYSYLLQSSFEYIKFIHPFQSDVIVCRGLQTGGKKLIALYVSMIGE
jgi:hypothetical protein